MTDSQHRLARPGLRRLLPASLRFRRAPTRPTGPPRVAGSLLRLSVALAIGYAALAGGLMYWQVVEANRLTNDPLNPLVLAAARNAPRGAIFDRNGELLARNIDTGAEPLREYPYIVAAPVIGYRSLVFGSTGIERAWDGQLTGLVSLRPGDELLRKFNERPYNPSDVHLSLDIRLQQMAADLLGEQHGAIVAIEPASGRVLALVSSPTYNPNRVVEPGGAGRRYVAALRERDDSPLLNRAAQGLYVPGSVFKIVTAIAGFSSGAINGSKTYPTDEEYEDGFLVQGFRIHDFPRRVQTDHPLNFFEATEVSSNIWFAHAGLDAGAPAMVDAAARLGLGGGLPFEIATSPGQLNGGDGPMSGFRDQVELANAAYGQAEVLVTPLQMALVAATVANGGVLMTPRLTDELRTADGTVTPFVPAPLGQVLSPSDATVIGQAMQLAVEGPFGQTFAGAAKVPGIPTAGKSGTAELGGDEAPHSWFIGYAPADAPQIAVAVIVEHGGAGASRAVPMGGEVMSFFLGASD